MRTRRLRAGAARWWLGSVALLLLAPAATAQGGGDGSGADAAKTTPGASAGSDDACGIGFVQRASASGGLAAAAPPPKPPSPAQLKALEIMEREAKRYEKGANDYRRTLTMIVRHHYEERRQRILSGLDAEIDVEKKGLVLARKDAIKRLEEFIARYSGDNAHPQATPDAMFRLAALYEERGRADFDSDLAETLKPAIAMYLRIIKEYPGYEEYAAVHYYLGHALTDANRLDEGQQAFRTLVCHNRYEVDTDAADAGKVAMQDLVQDHDDKFWNEWYMKHPLPLDRDTRPGARKAARLDAPEDEELSFRDPYPDDCKPLPQQLEPGQDPKYVAESWWKIGDFHFDQLDRKGGPYALNRAVSAYEHSMEITKPPLYGVAMYKRAWTYFKQQRYRTAIEWFIKLLDYADEQERKTGDPGADFRAEAYTYIAGSLTYVDLDGPPPEDPYIARNDVLDTELDPLVAEDKMKVAIERVQDPKLIPQDKEWTVNIYQALAQEFIEITQNRNAIATLALTLEKFPLHRDAPKAQARIAELYDALARLAPEGSAAREEYGRKALEARTALAKYVGTTPWTNANKDDPEAIAQAEQLVRGGLKKAAADHTIAAGKDFERAKQMSDPEEQTRLINRAIEEYRLAATGWQAYLQQDPNASDAYESKFWLADARYWIVVLKTVVDKDPTPEEIRCARLTAVAVRDSNEDDEYLQPSAYYLVSMSEKLLDREYKKYEESSGASGIQKREEVEFTGEGETKKPKKEPVPELVKEAIKARDEYNARIPYERDPEKNGLLYAYQSGDYYFVYGHFDEARKRFRPLYDKYCGKNEWGYKAWEKLISMSNFEGDAAKSRELAEAKSCAYDEDTAAKEKAIKDPVKMGVAYLDARKLYEEAEKMQPGPARDKKWREAAAAYKAALDAAPARKEAPEAAINGAYAYKQVGEYDKAIEMYELFIREYGDEKTLAALKNGDPAAKPPKDPDPAEYEKRVKYLKDAYSALADAYILFFNYPKAAETNDTISNIEHFSTEDRRAAAKQALSIYASLGDDAGMSRARKRFAELGASPEELAEADFIAASSELKKWDENSPDTGANAAARRKATTAMMNYYTRYRPKTVGRKYVVEAAYSVAKMLQAAGSRETDKWRNNTIKAFETYAKSAPKKSDGSSEALGTRYASMAAEAEFAMIDEDLRKKYDYETGKHKYKGTTDKVISDYRKKAKEAKVWYDKLQHVIDAYVSPEWTVAALARQGSVYDSLRTGLYNTRPPDLQMYSKKEEALLTKLENSGNDELLEKADAFRVKRETDWRTARDRELDGADQIAVSKYGTSVVLAKRFKVSNPAVTNAIQRLAYLSEIIGEAKMKAYASSVKDLNYTEGMFQRIRPGKVVEPKPEGMPHPLPVLAQ